jgi:catechol 2,3-dioxygenase-like lactoylglutathione lyase family enzyme
MKNRTLSVSVSADRDTVFAFLAKVENLPVWAPAFAAGWRKEGEHWRGISVAGDLYFSAVADERTGVIDILFGTQPDEMTLMPLRVVRQSHGSTVLGTVFHPADWAEELFEQHYGIMLVAFRGLAERFEGGAVLAAPGEGNPFYPGIVTARLYESWDFYTAKLGFRTLRECDHYVQLVHPCGAQVSLLRHELDGPASELVSATDGRGFWLNLDVADADAEFARLTSEAVNIVAPPEDKPWGDRQFVIKDPNGVLIAIAHRNEVLGRESRPLAAN